jgi:calcineurin-like phosphoesterase family protein
MKTWVTSDLHWGHRNIMSFCEESRKRFNNDLPYMNETMVREWNELIAPEDTVYILGDVAFMSGQDAAKVVNRLNGIKILIEGNHDRKNLQHGDFRNAFNEVHKYLEVTYDKHLIVMCHYPFAEWNCMHRGSLHFFGHLHGGVSGMERYRSFDVGMDATGVIAISMEDAIASAMKGAIKEHH